MLSRCKVGRHSFKNVLVSIDFEMENIENKIPECPNKNLDKKILRNRFWVSKHSRKVVSLLISSRRD
jgi:hypothetical protein